MSIHTLCRWTLSAFYRLKFESTAAARSVNASTEVAGDGIVNASAAAGYLKEASKSSSFLNGRGNYYAVGWSSPEAVLLSSAAEMENAVKEYYNTQQGKEMEAVLGEYTNIADYRAALKEYEEGEVSPKETYKPIDVRQLPSLHLTCLCAMLSCIR